MLTGDDEAIWPRPLEGWVRERLPVFARVPLAVEPWKRPREKDVRLIETYAGPAVTAEWVPDGTWENAGPPVNVSRVLPRFLALVTCSPSRVLRFVRDFGPLRLTDGRSVRAGLPFGAAIPDGGVPARAQPVTEYQRYARLAASVLRLTAGLRAWARGSHVPAWSEDIETVRAYIGWYHQEVDLLRRAPVRNGPPRLSLVPLGYPARFDTEYRNVVEMVLYVVNWWIETAGVRPYLASRPEGLQQVYYTGRLWGALGLGLSAAITQQREGVICANCGRLLKRTRWHRGRALYCQRPACRRAAWLEQKRRQRGTTGSSLMTDA